MSPAAAAATEAEAGGRQAANHRRTLLFLARLLFFKWLRQKPIFKISRKSANQERIAMSNEARYVAGKKLLEARKTEAAIELFQEILEEK